MIYRSRVFGCRLISQPLLSGEIRPAMKFIYLLAIAAVLAIGRPAYGHHSGSIFDLESVATLQGKVSRYQWRNPHVYIYVEAADRTGRMVEWQVETDATPILSRSGWTASTLAVGDLITVRAYLDRNKQRHHALLVSLTKSDGVSLTSRSGRHESDVEATDISGIWDVLPGHPERLVVYGKLTNKGAAKLAEYTTADDPVADCVPYPSPGIFLLPYLNEIEFLDDRILIRNEFFNVDRTVYMDGRGHPENGERSNQGHSIGRWDGDILVIDTTLFTDHRIGNLRGLPSGDKKRVIEKYRLGDDRTKLLIDFTVEDLEYMAEPMTGSTVWEYAPNFEMLRFECDPEVASLYKFE